MPNAGDPYLTTALPLSHNPLQRMGYTSQKPFLDPAVIEAAEEAAITAFLTLLKTQTGLDLLDFWNKSLAVKHANEAFAEAVQAAIDGYTDWATFIAQFDAAWNTWVVAASSGQTVSLNGFLNSMFGMNSLTGLTDPAKIAGINVGETLVDTLTTGVNQLGSALGGDVADSGGWSWLANLMAGLGVNSTSPLAPVIESAQSSAQVLAIVDSEPVQQNLEQTVVSSGDHKLAVALSSSPITSTASLGTIITAGQAKTFGFLQWMGEHTSTLTDFVANFYRMDDTGNLVYLFSTSDIGPGVPGTMAWIVDVITALPCAATDLIGIELQVVTSGSVTAWGFTAPPAGNHPSPTALVKRAGFSQNWSGATASTISAGSIGWVDSAPYVGLGVGSPPPTPFFPQQKPYYASSTHTPPSWATLVDLVGVGAGGGGEGETGAGNGDGGTAGTWGGVTLTVGVTNMVHAGMDIPIGGVITITVGAGGAGGAFFTPGSDGTPTVFSWTDMGGTPRTLSCAAGLGGQPSTNLTSWGLSPGNFTFDAYYYTGGPQNVIGGVGNPPGGGGTGGAAFQFGFVGARGQAWTVDRQS